MASVGGRGSGGGSARVLAAAGAVVVVGSTLLAGAPAGCFLDTNGLGAGAGTASTSSSSSSATTVSSSSGVGGMPTVSSSSSSSSTGGMGAAVSSTTSSSSSGTGGGCTSDADCSGGSPCITATCTNHACFMEPTPAGASCTGMTGVCDGKGSCVACTSTPPAGCAAGQTCVNGACKVVPLLSYDFTHAAITQGVFTSPPAGLTIACPTSGRTVQTSASTLVSGLGPNTWRAHSVNGATFGLLIERATVAKPVPVNPATSGGDWQSFSPTATVTPNFAPGPDGTTTATRVQMANGQYGPVTAPGPAGPYTYSFWALRNGGGTAYWHRVSDGSRNASIAVPGYGASWVRASISFATSSAGVIGAFDARAAANPSYDGSPVDIVSAWHQAEPGLYPTSNIAGARAADVLSGDATKLVPAGYFDWQLQIAPSFAQNEQAADAPLVFLDASNQVFLRASDSKVCVEIAGAVVLTSAPLTFSRNQSITVHVIDSSTQGLLMSVQGATSGNGLVSGTAAPMSTPATAFVLGSNAGAQECFDLQGIAVLPP